MPFGDLDGDKVILPGAYQKARRKSHMDRPLVYNNVKGGMLFQKESNISVLPEEQQRNTTRPRWKSVITDVSRKKLICRLRKKSLENWQRICDVHYTIDNPFNM
jgi:hypothetical protein